MSISYRYPWIILLAFILLLESHRSTSSCAILPIWVVSAQIKEPGTAALETASGNHPPTSAIHRLVPVIRADSVNPHLYGGSTSGNSTWPVEHLRLSAPQGDCLVWKIGSDSCVVSVFDFNQHAGTIPVSSKVPLDSARSLVLEKAINCRYFMDKAHQLGLDKNPTFLQAWERKARLLTRQRPNTGPPGLTELRKLYDENYEARFSRKEWVKYLLLASTNPHWLDSVNALMTKDYFAVRKSRRKNVFESGATDSLPWMEMTEETLPLELAKRTDTLGVGETSPLLTTSYGGFFVRIQEAGVRPAKSFEAAQSELNDMAFENRISKAKRLVTEKDLKKWYRENYNKLRPQPILYGQLWIFPHTRGFEIDIGRDTLGHKPRLCSTSALPDGLSRPILNRAGTGASPGSLIGPIRTSIGRILFKVEKIHKVKGPPSFEAVRIQIQDILTSRTSNTIELSSREREVFLKGDMLATAAFQNMVAPVVDSRDPQWRRDLAVWKHNTLEINRSVLQSE